MPLTPRAMRPPVAECVTVVHSDKGACPQTSRALGLDSSSSTCARRHGHRTLRAHGLQVGQVSGPPLNGPRPFSHLEGHFYGVCQSWLSPGRARR